MIIRLDAGRELDKSTGTAPMVMRCVTNVADRCSARTRHLSVVGLTPGQALAGASMVHSRQHVCYTALFVLTRARFFGPETI